MEKKFVLTVVILTTLFNVFFFLHINNSTVDELLLDKTIVSFHFHTNDRAESKAAFLNKIKVFSEENCVEIAQYSFLSSDKIDIYSTMKDKYKEILFVPNFIFNRDIQVHNFDEILDVGFKNLLYVDTNDMNIIQNFSETLKNDCELFYLETTLENNKFFKYKDINSFSIISLILFTFILVIFFYYSMSKKRFFIYKLWGYTGVQIYHILNKPLYKSLLLTAILSNFVLCGLLYKFIFSSLLLEVLFAMLKVNIAIVLLIFILSIPLFCLFCSVTNNNNRKKGLTKMMIISYLLKILLFILIILSIEQYFCQSAELKEKLDGLTLWKDTKNLFNLYETYAPYYIDNLAAEDVLNGKIFRVYKELSDLDKVFIMKTTNFERPGTENLTKKNKEDIDYSYKLNIEKAEDLYSPYGINIVVDKNYLKKHTVKSLDGKNVIDMINYNDNVLNILVPFKLKKYQNIIENSFQEWFYFQKVEVTNIYKESRGQSKIQKRIDDLKINIIYIENGQNLFTYNPNSGDIFNTIEDSIITVYTENIDNSFLAACLGDYIFIESTDEYSALKEISAITQKHNVIELNSIASVYDKKGEEIRNVEANLFNLIFNTIIMFLFLMMLMIVIIYIYYKSCFLIIIIKSLHGHSFRQTYKQFILADLLINIFTSFFVAIIYRKVSFYMMVILVLMSVIDYFILKIINRCFVVKGEIHFIKGK